MIGVIIVIVLVLVLLFWIGIKVNGLKDRATQHILRDTPLSAANIYGRLNHAVGGRVEEKFLKDFPDYTKESLQQFIQETAMDIKEKRQKDNMSDKVKQKMMVDDKISMFFEKAHKRDVIEAYGNGRLNVTVIYADQRDEYGLALFYKILDNKLILDDYTIKKGVTLGF